MNLESYLYRHSDHHHIMGVLKTRPVDYWVDFTSQAYAEIDNTDMHARLATPMELNAWAKDDSKLLVVVCNADDNLSGDLYATYHGLIQADVYFVYTVLEADVFEDQHGTYQNTVILAIFNFDSVAAAMLAKLIIGDCRSLEVEEYRGLYRNT